MQNKFRLFYSAVQCFIMSGFTCQIPVIFFTGVHASAARLNITQCHLVQSLNVFINYQSVDCWQIPNVLP